MSRTVAVAVQVAEGEDIGEALARAVASGSWTSLGEVEYVLDHEAPPMDAQGALRALGMAVTLLEMEVPSDPEILGTFDDEDLATGLACLHQGHDWLAESLDAFEDEARRRDEARPRAAEA